MENPFVKLVREGEGSSMEKETAVDTNFEVRDDGVEVLENARGERRDGEWEPLDVPSDNSALAREKYKAYRQARGLSEE